MKIGIFRALKLGDFLCATPAIRCIKQNFPDATLYIIGLPEIEGICKRNPYIDEFINFPGYPGLPEQPPPANINPFIQEMRAIEFDLLLQMQGNGTIVNDFLSRFDAKRLAGFCPYLDDESADWLYYPQGIHEIYKHLRLLKKIGFQVDFQNCDIDYPLYQLDKIKYEYWKNEYLIKRYAVVHVGSSSAGRQWPIENFLYLTIFLINNGFQIVLTGVASENARVEQLSSLLNGYTINMVGKTDLGLIGTIITNAKVLVSNCTGVSHIAAATKTKSIIISLDGEPERWGPLNHQLHRTYDATRRLELTKIKNDLFQLLASGSNGLSGNGC
ncbi:glycosyltransferase family 9 protein [Sphingobacterium kitahiroshimense]|uniref:Glycosyltransferase family 9 protein n=1 Tax=Sphingobacterium kitahiroshimense TaxID=470446 RepID=A0ABV0BY49_9SPHI